MAELIINNSNLGSALTQLLMVDELQPGDEPSYQACKTIYLYHPLGSKMVDAPITMAMSQDRDITVPESPEERVVQAFQDEWRRMKIDELIANTASISRVYGVGSVVMGAVGKPSDKPLDPDKYADYELFFNVVDPLNTAGSIVLNQDPNSPDFQKHTVISVAGQNYHRSRACVMMNEKPIYIAYTNSGFGYVGRSVYQRALYPLKTFVQSMITDDMVTTKAGLLIAKMQPAGSIVDRLMQGFAGLKRQLLAGAATGQVLSISAGSTSANAETIETLNMQNVDGAGGWARTNVMKNIATAADMPAVLLENETLTKGFGEGTEDAKNIARYIEHIRDWLEPLYEFFEPIVMRRAWNPEFYKTIQKLFPDEYGSIDYNTALYQWINSFHATWPNFLVEPESEKVKTAEVKLKALIAVAEILLPIADPENKANVLTFLADNINADQTMFTSPLLIDPEAFAEYEPPMMAQQGEPKANKPFAASDAVGRTSRLPAGVVKYLASK